MYYIFLKHKGVTDYDTLQNAWKVFFGIFISLSIWSIISILISSIIEFVGYDFVLLGKYIIINFFISCVIDLIRIKLYKEN